MHEVARIAIPMPRISVKLDGYMKLSDLFKFYILSLRTQFKSSTHLYMKIERKRTSSF